MSFAVAIVVGYFYSQGMLDKLKPTSYYLESLEGQGGSLNVLSRSKGWILAGAAIGNDAWAAQNSMQAGGGGAPSSGGGGGGEARAEPRPNPFAGQGHRLSSGGSSGSSGAGGWLSSALAAASSSSSSSSSSAAPPAAADRETIAARRLAALGGGGGRTVGGSSNSGGAGAEAEERLLGDTDGDVAKLSLDNLVKILVIV